MNLRTRTSWVQIPAVSEGYSQLNGVLWYLLVVERSLHHPWWGLGRLSELFGVWDASGRAHLPHREHHCFASRQLLPAAGSRDASSNHWKLCSPAQCRAFIPPVLELYTPSLWEQAPHTGCCGLLSFTQDTGRQRENGGMPARPVLQSRAHTSNHKSF